jgi:hypothetical protein
MGGIFNVVNLHVYHYSGNNPIKYTDPDGRDIESLNVENNNFFLKLITQIAGAGFSFDESNKLKIDESIEAGNNYSPTARAQFVFAINNNGKTAYLKASTAFDTEGRGELGMARWVEGNANAMIAFVFGTMALPDSATNHLSSMFNANTNNGQAIGLIHELPGHVLPSLGITNGTDAMGIERQIRNELGWGTNLGSLRGGLNTSEGAVVQPQYTFNLNTAKRMK